MRRRRNGGGLPLGARVGRIRLARGRGAAVTGSNWHRCPHSGERGHRVVTGCLVGSCRPVTGGNGKKGTGQVDLWPRVQFQFFPILKKTATILNFKFAALLSSKNIKISEEARFEHAK
jgi:hypothetical protein